MVKPSRPPSKRSITLPKGFRAAGGAFGIKPSGNPDLALIVADEPCSAAGVFTQNKCVGAPVVIGRKHIKNGQAQAVVVNAGCSNVMTGEQGLTDAMTMCEQTAQALGCKASDVLPSSTGIIGHLLPMQRLIPGIHTLASGLARGLKADTDTAEAILTTDLAAKASVKKIKLGDKTVTLAGIAKGSGMIQPNMATMLSFITTDADITPKLLNQALKQAVSASFNRISVDHDTSTSDMVLLLASAKSGAPPISCESQGLAAFTEALTRVCAHLAEQIICDGEGATRIFEVVIENAWSEKDADRIGYALTGSPLVKTAVHGSDPNWGRLLMAAGRSGARFEAGQTNLWIGKTKVLSSGEPLKLTPSQQSKLEEAMTAGRVIFRLNLGYTQKQTPACKWLGCDLSRDYVRINADYTT